MTRSTRPDPLDELADANPVPSDRAPSESKARIRARIQEVTMEDNSKTRSRPAGWLLGLGGVAVAGAVIAVLALNNGGDTPSPTDDPGTGIGSCVEHYSPGTLANRDFAFDGTVTAIAGDQVTFDVTETFVGEVSDAVTLTASGMTGTSVTSAGGPNLSVDDRYLVAGDGEFAWACGFTQRYDDAIAAEWADATR
ncbi:MAG: hypothetical protein ABIZ57_02580 [Candidatus Limnocylindria bacterium]